MVKQWATDEVEPVHARWQAGIIQDFGGAMVIIKSIYMVFIRDMYLYIRIGKHLFCHLPTDQKRFTWNTNISSVIYHSDKLPKNM